MFDMDNPLMILSCVASDIREREQDPVAYMERDPSRYFIKQVKEIYSADAKVEKGKDLKSIPNRRVTEYIDNTSDELSKRFSFKCRFPECSKVTESYGNDKKAFCEMKEHLLLRHSLGDLSPETAKRAKQDMTKSSNNLKSMNKMHRVDEWKPVKRFRSEKMSKSVLAIFNRGEAEKTDEKNVHVSLDTDLEANESTDDIVDTIKFGELEHTYARNPDKLSNSIPPVRVTGQKKKRPDAEIVFDLEKYQEAIFQQREPMIIHTPPFPFIFTPFPLEAVCNVEFHSNGDPVDVKESVSAQPSTSRISSKKAVENKPSRKKSKFGLAVNLPRSVLERVENRVTCKSNASSEQKDAILPDNSVENSENVEESIYQTAWKHIRILVDQRKKRTYRDKPKKGYVCEICNKHFTANTSLIYHYLGHLKIKAFECDICERAFTRRHSLNYHMMIHFNQNRFHCQECGRRFRHPSHFKDHLIKHTDEEPFSCSFCPNKFKTRNSYKRHLKMQHQKLLTPIGIVPILNNS